MKIFVVGKLGEVIKKVIELEELIKEHPTSILIAELTSYQQVLNMWPVTDKNVLDTTVQYLRYSIVLLREAEKELRAYAESKIEFHICDAITQYCKCLDTVRGQIRLLNELGMYIGDSPILEVEDAEPS